MPNIDQMFPSKYIKAGDCEEADLQLTIAAVKQESIGQGDEAETKFVVYFDEHDKGLVLNKTNASTIAELHGRNTDQWIGKRISLYATEVEYGGKVSMGIRIRLRAPKPASAPTGDAPADLLTMAQARTLLDQHGVSVDALKNLLIEQGRVNAEGKALYDPARDTATVLKLVADAKAAAVAEPF